MAPMATRLARPAATPRRITTKAIGTRQARTFEAMVAEATPRTVPLTATALPIQADRRAAPAGTPTSARAMPRRASRRRPRIIRQAVVRAPRRANRPPRALSRNPPARPRPRTPRHRFHQRPRPVAGIHTGPEATHRSPRRAAAMPSPLSGQWGKCGKWRLPTFARKGIRLSRKSLWGLAALGSLCA